MIWCGVEVWCGVQFKFCKSVHKKTKKGVYISSKIIALFPVISEVHSRQDNCVGVVVCSKLF